jgi:hypothetical protein
MMIRIFGILSLLILSACEPKDPVKDKTRHLSDYERNSCAYGFDDGGKALDLITTHDYSKASFGITFDRKQVEAVLGASAKGTVDYLERHNIKVFSVSVDTRGCQQMEKIPQASESLKVYWGQLSRLVTDDFLLGAFLTPEMSFVYGLNSHVIMIRSDADRWILLHEYIHFLFSYYREVKEKFNEDTFFANWEVLNTQAKEQLSSLDDNRLAIDEEFLVSTAELWTTYAENLAVFLKNSYLEEMAIENIIQDYTRSGQFLRVSSYANKNSIQYLRENFFRAQALLLKAEKLGQGIKNHFGDDIPSELKGNFSRELNNLKSLRTEGEKIFSKYNLPGPSQNPPVVERFSWGCGHLPTQEEFSHATW